MSIVELSQHSGWHENTVRGHLHALWKDGYLTRQPDEERHGRGRPSWLWQMNARKPMAPYIALATTLADSLSRTSENPAAEAREAGRSWGRALSQGLPRVSTREDAQTVVVDVMRDQGFAPQQDADDSVITLNQCPLAEAAAHNSTVVCAVHLGMVVGVLESVGIEDDGSELQPFTTPGTCTLKLRAVP